MVICHVLLCEQTFIGIKDLLFGFGLDACEQFRVQCCNGLRLVVERKGRIDVHTNTDFYILLLRFFISRFYFFAPRVFADACCSYRLVQLTVFMEMRLSKMVKIQTASGFFLLAMNFGYRFTLFVVTISAKSSIST